MSFKSITSQIKNLLENKRIAETTSHYVHSLMLPLAKHTQVAAAKLSRKDNSTFSRFLSENTDSSTIVLNRSSRRYLASQLKKRKIIFKDAPWKVMLIIDATLHNRSSERIQNSQKRTHGKGWKIGHQWTNIGILINDVFIPLPPIPAYTKKECKERGIPYKTEHEKVVDFLRTFSLKSLTQINVDPSEIVVLLDAGYDCKSIQQTIISRKWDFVVSIKSSRTIMSSKGRCKWNRIVHFFKDGRRPWKSLRIKSYRGKRKNYHHFSYKQQVGYLKDIRRKVKLVCSRRSKDKKVKFLACSNLDVSIKTIIQCYKKRWDIELFHRDIKSYLGLEDAGVKNFDSLHSHVNWVYVAYIMLRQRYPKLGIKAAQEAYEREQKVKELRSNLQLLSQINGEHRLKIKYSSVIKEFEMLKAA